MEMFRHESAIHLVKTNIEQEYRDVRSSVGARLAAGNLLSYLFPERSSARYNFPIERDSRIEVTIEFSVFSPISLSLSTRGSNKRSREKSSIANT